MKKALMVALLISALPAESKVVQDSEISWINDMPEVSQLDCREFTKTTFSQLKPKKVTVSESIFSTKKLMPDSYFTCSIWNDNKDSQYIIKPVENWNVDGHDIRVHHADGSGRIDGNDDLWSFGCKSDAMTDEYYCYLSAKNMTILKDADGYQVNVGYRVPESSKSLIRFNKDKPIESNFGGVYEGEKAINIIERLNQNPKVTIRYYSLGNKKPVDEIIDISDFNIAKNTLDKIYSSHK